MIKAKELRIGSIIKCEEVKQFRVDEMRWFDHLGYIAIMNIGKYPNKSTLSLPLSAAEPIPLTEELLLRCGLDQVGTYFVSELLGIGTLRFALKKIKNHFFIEYGGKYIRVESLHELQNIYYFITKRELKIEI